LKELYGFGKKKISYRAGNQANTVDVSAVVFVS
jgi:hypothetical protein